MVALNLVILGVLGCAIWHFIVCGSKRVWKYHQEHDLLLFIGELLTNTGNWIIGKGGGLTFNWPAQFHVANSFLDTA